jgi:uncharacterized protein
MQAADIVALLDLAPHPEGGYYRQTYADPLTINGRACSTCIYFLLPAGVTSRWHRVDAVETWHWYAGSPLDLRVAANDAHYASYLLGNDVIKGQRPQAVVPTGHWQQAVSQGAWTLVGCTVAPGFTFDGFEIAPADFAPNAAEKSPS